MVQSTPQYTSSAFNIDTFTSKYIPKKFPKMPMVSDLPQSSYTSQVEPKKFDIDEFSSRFAPLSNADLPQSSYTSELPQSKYNFPESLSGNIPKVDERFDSRIGAYVSTKPEHQYGTSVVTRIPDIAKQKVIDKRNYEGDLYGRAITGIPASMVGGIFTAKLTEKEKTKIDTIPEYFNLKKQFEVFKSKFDYERDYGEAVKVSKKLEEFNQEFQKEEGLIKSKLDELGKGNIDKSGLWIGDKKSLEKYNKLIENYNSEREKYLKKFESYSSDESYKNVIESGERTDLYQDIAVSNLSEGKKGVLAGVVGFTDMISYKLPPTRFIRGTDLFSGGLYGLDKAKTEQEKKTSGFDLVLGGVLMGSSFFGGKTTGRAKDVISQVTSKRNILKKGIDWGLNLGISGLYGYSIGKESGSVAVGIGAGIGSIGALKSGEIYSGLKKLGGKTYFKTIGKMKVEGKTLLNKRGQSRLSLSYEEEMVTAIDEYGNAIRLSKAEALARKLTIIKGISSRQAMQTFAELPKERQVNIIKMAFKNKFKEVSKNTLFLDRESELKFLRKNMNMAIEFMKKSGLNNNQIKDILKSVFPRLFQTPMVISSEGGILKQKSSTQSLVTPKLDISQEYKQKEQTLQRELLKTNQLEVLGLKSVQLYNQKSSQVQKSVPLLKYNQKSLYLQKTKQIPALKLISPQLEISSTKEISQSKVIPQLIYKTKERIDPIGELITAGKSPIKPKEPRIPKPINFFGMNKIKNEKEEGKEGGFFEVFVKKFGKDVSIGKFRTLGKAKKSLKTELVDTLRASGFITKEGKKVKFGIEDFGSEFRKAKSDQFRIVQKSSKRLGRKSETKEIQFFRTRGGKDKWF